MTEIYHSGIQKLTLAGNSIEFKTKEGSSYIFTLPANQYWLSSDITATAGSHYAITVSGMISTGMGKFNNFFPDNSNYDFSNRDFRGKLEYAELVNIINSPNECIQLLSDILKIYKDAPYGSLLVGAFTEDEINLVRQNPWQFSERIIPVAKAQQFSTHYTAKNSRWDLSMDVPRLFVNSNKLVLHFVINDSVIPLLDQNVTDFTSALYTFVIENINNSTNNNAATDIKKACTEKAFSEARLFLGPSLSIAARLEEQSKAKGYSSRAIWFLDNKGSFTVVVDNKDN